MKNTINRLWLDNSPLASANYRNLWIGQAISTLGDRFTTIAIPILIFELTGSSAQLGLAFLAQFLAPLLIGLWAGALTDRWDRQRTMIGADLFRAAIVLIIPFVLELPLATNPKLAIIYALSFLVMGARQFFIPAKVSLIPHTVSEEQLLTANVWDQGTTRFMEAIGYTVAGFLIALTSPRIAFYVDAGTFILSALFIYRIYITTGADDATSDPNKPSMLTSIREGLAHAWSEPLLKALILISFIVPITLGAMQPLHIVFSEEILEGGQIGFGLLNATMALGSAIGFFVNGRLITNRHRGYLLSLGAFFLGLFQLLGVVVPVMLKPQLNMAAAPMIGELTNTTLILMSVTLPFFLLTTVAASAIFLGYRIIVQESTPNKLIGRVFSVVTVSTSLGVSLGAATAGLADIFGVAQTMIGWSSLLIVIGAVAYFHPVLRPDTPTMIVTE